MTDVDTPDVLVIGAGPTGLLLAVVLARRGVRVAIVDRKAGPTVESRAVVLQARTMEIYDQLGIAGRMAAASTEARFVVPGYGRRRFGKLKVGAIGEGVTPFPRLTVLEQSKTESILGAHLAELGVSVGWNATVELPEGLAASGEVVVRSPEGVRRIRARYVVGADGSNSAVRRALGIDFAGSTYGHTFFVCDADQAVGLVADAVNLRLGDAEFLLTFPLDADNAAGHHRIIGLLPPTGGGDIVESSARAAVDGAFGVRWGQSKWFSTYRVQHRTAAVFRKGHVFLAGDAAHVHSPVGAQGMNTGLQDAHNLALKLVDVLSGRAPESYLDRYEAERRPVALRLMSTTDRVFGLATSSTPRARWVRRRVAPVLAPFVIRVLPRLPGSSRFFEYLSQTRIHYWMDAGAKQRENGRRDPVVGRRLPWTGGNYVSLRSFEWQVHGYGGSDAAEVGAALGVPAHSFASIGRTALAPGLLYLVRPDGFVAAKAAPSHAERVFGAALPWR
ncbi:FAD-dependent monooxygenase [Lacisediminihabitans sp.]|uniref:FAD-dependent monooxygenase n=1 Tax=Lacisediminihabitans sp. TaxID=2787631 RepID=UPI00374DAE2D